MVWYYLTVSNLARSVSLLSLSDYVPPISSPAGAGHDVDLLEISHAVIIVTASPSLWYSPSKVRISLHLQDICRLGFRMVTCSNW